MWQSLGRAIPSIDRLAADPRGTLTREEVRIAPATKYPLFIGTGMLAILAPVLLRHHCGLVLTESAQLTLICAIATISFVVLIVIPFGMEVVLTADGVRLRRGVSEVFCPWALFHAPGNIFVRQQELVLPIAPEAIPYIEQRDNERIICQGTQIQSPLFQIRGTKSAVLFYRFNAPPEELGKLLLHLGRVLGDRLPAGAVPPEAYPIPETGDQSPVTAAKDGWVTMSLTRLTFPPVCCNCGERASFRLPLDARGHIAWALLSLGHFCERMTLEVPICRSCHKTVQRARRRGRWAAWGFGLFLAVMGLIPWLIGPNDKVGFLIFFSACATGLMAGILIRGPLTDALVLPARAGRYSPRANTVRLRFRRPEYVGLVCPSADSLPEDCTCISTRSASPSSHREEQLFR
jgi:hypothetical protein